MRIKHLLAATLLIFNMASLSFGKNQDANLDYERAHKNVRKLQKNIEKKKDEAAHLSQREKETASELERIENSIRQQSSRLAHFTRVLQQKEADCSNAERRLAEAEQEAEHYRRQARSRIISYYKFGNTDLIKLVLASRSIPDLFARQEGLRFILRNDMGILSEYRSRIDLLGRKRQELLASRETVKQLKEKIGSETLKLEALRRGKAYLLTSISKKQQECQRDLMELEKAAESLNHTIRTLEREMEKKAARDKPSPSLGFTALKGKLDPPIKGGRIVGLFGRERRSSSGASIVRNGIDILATQGTEIHCVYTGRVIYAGNIKGYGNILILDHADKYYSLYAHAAKFTKQVGNLVKKGETIGTLGGSGSPLGDTLYFEIRHGGQPENPLSWINTAMLAFN